jgi:5'-3' exonuclease
MKFLIVDVYNTFFRARHGSSMRATDSEKIGMALHITLSSIAKCWREQQADHVCIALDGRSWRKDHYLPYKRNRVEARAAATPAQQAEDQLMWQALDQLKDFFINKTNCTILHHAQLEADDLIAGWIQHRPNDQHVIISSDSDFVQLLAANVSQYNGVADELITLNGIFNGRGQLVKDKKTGEPKAVPDPEWALFEKCMRGDSTDNIFSAYPGVRTKGSKNKVGLQEAFDDRNNRGWAWNNLMLQTWIDHLDQSHRVLEDYNRNRMLIDLQAQPLEIRELIDHTVKSVATVQRPLVGAQFLKFCGQFDLLKLSDRAEDFARILGSSLPGPSGESNT